MRSFIFSLTILSTINIINSYQPTADPDGNFRIIRDYTTTTGLNFTILGDWGGFPAPWYHTPYQTSAAKLLNKISVDQNNQFTLAIGDNFYYYGVKSLYDKAWSKTWDQTYTSTGMMKPWYVILGNHDWQGSGQTQIDYSEYDNRWTLPFQRYTITYNFKNNISLKFILIDSQAHCDVNGPKKINTDYPIPFTEENRQEQLIWLNNELENSYQDNFVFLVSHYQVHDSKGTKSCMKDIDELMKKHKLSGHVFGHVHELSHMVSKTDEKLNYILSGMGSVMAPNVGPKLNSNENVDTKFRFSNIPKFKGGFVTSEVDGDLMIFRYYWAGAEKDDEPIYEFSLRSRF